MPHRRGTTGRGTGPARRPGHHQQHAGRAGAARDRAHLPAPGCVRFDDRRGQPSRRRREPHIRAGSAAGVGDAARNPRVPDSKREASQPTRRRRARAAAADRGARPDGRHTSDRHAEAGRARPGAVQRPARAAAGRAGERARHRGDGEPAARAARARRRGHCGPARRARRRSGLRRRGHRLCHGRRAAARLRNRGRGTCASGRAGGLSRRVGEPGMIELSVQGLRAGYGAVEVLHGIDLDVPRGALTALLGPNGAGKTTLLSVVAGLHPLQAGVISWGGVDVSRTPPDARARAGMTLIPERRGIFPDLTVRENIDTFIGADGDAQVALDAFPVLAQRMAQRAGSLSGGEQQMLAMSRALLKNPRLLLLDEISFGLAPRVTRRLFDVVAELAIAGTTVVLVEQYLSDALRLADVVYVLARGEVVFAGEPGELAGKTLPGYMSATPRKERPVSTGQVAG